jgi:hypothetical protein
MRTRMDIRRRTKCKGTQILTRITQVQILRTTFEQPKQWDSVMHKAGINHKKAAVTLSSNMMLDRLELTNSMPNKGQVVQNKEREDTNTPRGR